ncbi:unnamed protein product, partial [Urochloa humidicola]
ACPVPTTPTHARTTPTRQTRRLTRRAPAAMGGGGAHGGTTYKGYTIPHNKRWHTVAGKGLCAVMWFWVFYRAKQDGAVLLGLRHPWDGHDDHSHGHGHEHEASSSSSSSH